MKGYLVVIVGLLVLVSAAWIGISIFDATNEVDIDPRTEQFILPIQGSFDRDTLQRVNERVVKLPVAPKVYLDLESVATETAPNTDSSTGL